MEILIWKSKVIAKIIVQLAKYEYVLNPRTNYIHLKI